MEATSAERTALGEALREHDLEIGDWEWALEHGLDKHLGDLDVRHVDNGIGSYEFWGQRGFDSQPDVEIEGSGEFEVSWVAFGFDAPEAETITRTRTHTFEVGPFRYSEEAGETFGSGEMSREYNIECTLTDFKAERWATAVTVDGVEKKVVHWRMTASWRWEAST